MPLYEYECETCGARFELIQRFSDPPPDRCKVCGGPVHKLLSAPAIQFKGTGWYVTDYGRSKDRASPGHKQHLLEDGHLARAFVNDGLARYVG